ncbi:MAG: mannose-6-phosphate isomerase, class I [Candidatus Cloacimonetes bacterium]|nr:mannose-6-phosphate isomerase, class I [Candidatus Cloacimonadota bacterium]HOA28477.1 mannose-6-phosphate isomerase, class I [Candidatus Cloacimonadota bacterium]HOH59285.1 mannose-6-phosphate isomerase, class I [Candidatus Cloacimonadota bacterium]
MHVLKSSLQAYAWGSRSFIHNLLSISEPEIIAEMWMGSHPQAPSTIDGQPLDALIASDPQKWLGSDYEVEKPALSYLLKVLAASEPLSIQVHPNLAQAVRGFAAENSRGIALNDPMRNYKDANHKPELILALTPFDALCGIREYHQIATILSTFQISPFYVNAAKFCQNQDHDSFHALFVEILAGAKPELNKHLLLLDGTGEFGDELSSVRSLLHFYPNDPFVIAPCIMNLIHLRPSEAIYLAAGIPHAYLHGAGVEIMAASDNVLRAGLTPKYVDKQELLATVTLESYIPEIIRVPDIPNALHTYPTPVTDFQLSSGWVQGEMHLDPECKPAIILCLKGALVLQTDSDALPLQRGESAIILPDDALLSVSGNARFVLAKSAKA